MFSLEIFHRFLLRRQLRAAMDYTAGFQEQRDRLRKYRDLFENERYIRYPVSDGLNAVLLEYQRYFRMVFYLEQDETSAGEALRQGLGACLGCAAGMDEMEQVLLPARFEAEGLHFMGGRTDGFYGPYVWRESRLERFAVELPEGKLEYSVLFHDGFLCRSWLGYLSFDAIGPGGWSNGDGLINCVAKCYDVESETFRVSLLKHEAQHARDLSRWPDLPQEELEYRAKLVELIYSRQRNMLEKFAAEAGSEGAHARAARRIAAALEHAHDVSAAALELFRRSCAERKNNV